MPERPLRADRARQAGARPADGQRAAGRHARGVRGRRAPTWSSARRCATLSATRLERREQAMVLLNRRGFATSVFCRQCGSTLECPNCSVTLTVHRAARRARCHYCNYASGSRRLRALRRDLSRARRVWDRACGSRNLRALFPGRPRRARRPRHYPAPRCDCGAPRSLFSRRISTCLSARR